MPGAYTVPRRPSAQHGPCMGGWVLLGLSGGAIVDSQPGASLKGQVLVLAEDTATPAYIYPSS